MWTMTKVFVSSKQGELDPERAGLHHALQSPEWDNFTIEFAGAFPDSVREVFLKHVAECDVYLGIFANIYSQPTVDEYHEARRLGKPILIYLKDCAEREPALTKFITEELYPTHKCQSFKTTDELVSHLPDIRRALDAEVQKYQRQAYLDALVAQTELLELAGIVDSGEQERPKLQDIYIALSAAEEVEERDERQPKEKRERERPTKITRRVTIDQALREHRNLMILGDPGAGKSTLLRYLTLVAAETATKDEGPLRETEDFGRSSFVLRRELGLPILIRLSSFARSGQSFVEYFESYAEKQLHVSLGKKFFERALEDGQVIVCLDGLDEVSQSAQRIDVRNAITALASRYPRNRFVVTSRVAGYDSTSLDKRAFAHHTIVPFGKSEIQSFVEKWYAAREREPEQAKTRAANLFDDLKANERLMKLAENPLTLTIIALVHQRAQGKLPDARVELYDRCAETLIEEWDKWKGLAPEDRERPYYRLRRRLLERAAYWMHIESQEADVAQISKHALEMKVAEFLVEDKTLNLSEDTARIEAKQFVALVTSRTGILVEREQGAVSFIHLTFQEYFAASDLYWRYRKTPDALWQAIQPHLYDSRWLEVILLLLGRLNDEGDTPSIIVEKILREHDKFDEVIHRDLFLAARCLADGVKVHKTLQNKIVDTLLEFVGAKHSQYDSLCNDSIQALGTLRGNPRVAKGLLVLAQGERVDYQVQHAAVHALEQLGRSDGVIVNALLALAQNGKVYYEVQHAAAQALGQLGRGDEVMVNALLALAQDEKVYYQVRCAAAQALGQLERGDKVIVNALLALVQDEKAYYQVRCTAVQALGQLGRGDAVMVNVLLALAQDKKVYYQVRCAAVRVLGQLSRGDVVIVNALLALAQDVQADCHVRRDAAQALRQLGCADEVVVNSFLASVQDERVDALERILDASVLGELGRVDEAAKILLALAQDEKVDAWERFLDALILGQLGRVDEATRILLALAQDVQVDWYVRREAARELRQLGRADEVVVNALLASAQDAKVDAGGRGGAAHALAQLGRVDEAAKILLELVRDVQVDSRVRRDAMRALGQLGTKEGYIALALLELANDKEDIVRGAAYRALKEVVGNLRYAEVDNGQKRIKRTRRKGVQRTKAKTNGRGRARKRNS